MLSKDRQTDKQANRLTDMTDRLTIKEKKNKN